MSKESVGVVRAALEAFAHDGLDAALEFFDPDIDYRPIEGELVRSGVIRGREAFRAYFEELIETFDGFRLEIDELIDAGEHVIAMERIVGGIRQSEAVVETRLAVVLTVRERKIVRSHEYATREEALKAAGA